MKVQPTMKKKIQLPKHGTFLKQYLATFSRKYTNMMVQEEVLSHYLIFVSR